MRPLVALMTFAVSAVAFAGSLKNTDSREYRLRYTTAGADSTPSFSVGPQWYQEQACAAYPCTIEVMDTHDKATLTCREEHVEIKSGKLVVTLGGL